MTDFPVTIPIKLLGVVVGEAEGIDPYDTPNLYVYGFRPADHFIGLLRVGDVEISITEGYFIYHDDEMREIERIEILSLWAPRG